MKNSKMSKYRERYKKRIAKHKSLLNLTCLIVVDLQIELPAAVVKDPNMTAWRIIREAIKQEQVIVFVNYLIIHESGFQDVPSIVTYDERNIDILEDYMARYPDNVIFLRKNSDDGSHIIYDETRSKGIKRFEIIGVNTEHCVIDTAIGLSQKMPDKEIMIRFEACNNDYFSEKTERDVMREVAQKIIISKADNITFTSNNYSMTGKTASCIYAELSARNSARDLEYEYICQRNNAIAVKSGENSCSSKDNSIKILVLNDSNANTVLNFLKSGKDEKLPIYGVYAELTHPNAYKTEEYVHA